MAKLQVIRCVTVLIFLLYLKVILSNVGPLDVEIGKFVEIPQVFRFVPPVVLSFLIFVTIFYWVKYRQRRSTISKFLTVEFLVVIFSSVLLPTSGHCEPLNKFTDLTSCVNVNLSAQLVVFASIILQMSHSRYLKAFTYLIWFIAIICLFLYQKTSDVLISSVFVMLVFTNPFVTKISKFLIQESPYFERIHDVTISKHVITSI